MAFFLVLYLTIVRVECNEEWLECANITIGDLDFRTVRACFSLVAKLSLEFSISLHCQMFPDDSTPFLSAAELRGSKMKI